METAEPEEMNKLTLAALIEASFENASMLDDCFNMVKVLKSKLVGIEIEKVPAEDDESIPHPILPKLDYTVTIQRETIIRLEKKLQEIESLLD